MTMPVSSAKAAKNLPVPHLTAEKLSELACLLNRNVEEPSDKLVGRALEIWRASCAALSETKQLGLMELFSFDEIAEHKLLPALRASLVSVESSKGVEKAVNRYFNAVIDGYDETMRGRRISDELKKSNKASLTKLKEEVLGKKTLSKSILELLKQFQLNMRRNRHAVSVIEIRELLSGADVGLPDIDF
jgi:hypothetical protein